MSPMMAPSMINLLDTRRRMETSSLLFSSRETASPGWRTSKKKRLDVAAEASLQPRTACPGTKIAPRRSVCQHPASMARPAGKKRPPGCGQSGPAGGPASQGRWQSLDLSVLPLAADMATAVGHSRFAVPKGLLVVPQAPRWPPALTVWPLQRKAPNISTLSTRACRVCPCRSRQQAQDGVSCAKVNGE